MNESRPETLEDFLRRLPADALVDVLLELAPPQPHAEFAAEIRRRNGRKVAFRSRAGA